MKTRSSAFTLIELLVVIAIIAILLAVMVPGLKMAKRQTMSVICRTNLSSLQRGLILYAEDRDGKLFDYSSGIYMDPVGDYIDNIDKVRLCPEGGPISKALPSVRSGGWGKAREPWRWNDGTPDPGENHPYEYGSYGFNGWFYHGMNQWVPAGTENFPFQTFFAVKNTGRTACFGDANWVDVWPQNDNQVPANLDLSVGGTQGGTNPYAICRYIVDRHRNYKLNFSFVDGHVEPLDFIELWAILWHAQSKPNFNPNVPNDWR